MPISDILKDLTTSQSFDAASELERSFKKFSKQVNNAQNESNPSVIHSSSLDGVSRLNKSMPSSSPYDQFPQLGGFSHSSCNDDGERRRSGCQPLWTGTTRCPPRKPGTANDAVFQVTKAYFVAMIYSGAAGNGNTAWLVSKEMWVSNLIDRAWKIMATRMGRNTGRKDHDAAAEPPREEARLLFDIMKDWRSRAVQAVRRLVGGYYPWSECKTPEDVRQLCKDLLKDDCFTCLERTAEPPRGRFCAHIISSALRQIYWNSTNMGLALHAHTQELFDSLPAAAVVFACTCVDHTIREYKSGYFSHTNFEGPAVNATQTRFRNTFDNQSDARKSLQRILLLRRIHKQTNMKRLCAKWKVDEVADAVNDSVADPYSKSIDDLPLHELGGGEEGEDVSVNQCHDRDSHSSKSCDLSLKNRKPVDDEDVGEDVEDGTPSLIKSENTDRVETDGESGDFPIKGPFDIEITREGKMASNATIVNQWTWGDMWGFLETPEVGRSKWTSSSDPNDPTDKVISNKEEYSRFLLWVKDEKGKHRMTPSRVERESDAIPSEPSDSRNYNLNP